MGALEKILNKMLPNNRLETASQKMMFSLGDGDYFSDGSKYKRGIARSGSPRIYHDATRRINARNAYEESTVGRAIVRRHVDIVVDAGLKFKSKPLYQIIGISKEKAEKWADEFTQRFDLFMRSKMFSSSGTMTGYQFQRHLTLQQFKDGEYFTVFNRKIFNKKQISPLSFQIIDNQQVGNNVMTGFGSYTMTGGYNDFDFDNGIKRDEFCRELSYLVTWKKKNSERTEYEQKEVPAELPNGMTRMTHGFIQEQPNQLRGVSTLAPVLQELQHFLDFDISHIMKAIQHASLVLASETTGEENSVNLFEGLGVGQGSMILDQDDDTILSSTESTGPDGSTMTYRQMPEAQFQTPGSVSFFDLPKGNTVKLLDSKAPSTGYAEFAENFLSYLSAACDMSIDVLRMKFGSNYNANRATLILAWRIANIYRKELESDFLNYVTEAFLECEIAMGRISAQGFSDPVIRAAWLNGEWIGTPMPEMDPFKQMRANKGNVELGTTTLDRIAVETNGSDGRINRAENARQISELTRPFWVKEDPKNGSGDTKTNDNSDSTT